MNQTRYNKILKCLTDAFAPSFIELIDESHQHVGHAGAATGMSHYALTISSKKLNGLGAIEQHRKIYQTLGDLMQTDIHALRIQVAAE